MLRRNEERNRQHTVPDHCPVNPLTRMPNDPMDAAVRKVRLHYDEVNQTGMKNWR